MFHIIDITTLLTNYGRKIDDIGSMIKTHNSVDDKIVKNRRT